MTTTIIWAASSAIVSCVLTLIIVFIRTYSGTLNIYTGDDLEKDLFRYDLAISFSDLEKRRFITMIVKAPREENSSYNEQ